MLIQRINRRIYTLLLSFFFESVGTKTTIRKVTQLDNPKSIRIGNGSYVAQFSWMCGAKKSDGPTVTIGNKVQIGHYAHIIGLHKVCIEDSVLIADKVYISDTTHNYEKLDEPVIEQGERNVGEVIIGEGSWLGENVSILGAKIGKHCVIGANSYVNSDIPDFTVAVGTPAKVIKKYNFETKRWEKIYDSQN